MSMFADIAAEGIAERIEERAKSIVPHVVIGDEDSIDLSPYEAGRKAGLLEAAQIARAYG